jgi:hypothetical protein
MRNAVLVAIAAIGLSGCGMSPEWTTPPPGCPTPPDVAIESAAPAYANPIFLPIADSQCGWEYVVDVVNDYFRIEREEPIRASGNAPPTTGVITTAAEISPTIFEPWRRDTGAPPQWMENTLQTMRRRAVVRVTPAPGGQLVDVAVFKELENLPRPEHATAGAATMRYDDTLTHIVDPIGGEPANKCWIPQGRDTSLEQYIIGDLLGRCGQAGLQTSAPRPMPAPTVMPNPAAMPGPVATPAPTAMPGPVAVPATVGPGPGS